jgi:hypothetical protein
MEVHMGSLMGIVKWVAGTLVVTAVGIFIIRRVAFLNNLVFGASA